MRNAVQVTGIPIDKVTMSGALERVKHFLSEERVHTVYTPNAEIMMEAHNDHYFKSVLCEADLVIPDGAGVILASKILGCGLPEKVSGFDLLKNSFSINIGRKIRYFFFGCKPGVAEEAAKNIESQYPGIEVVGCRNGYYTQEEEPEIIEQINSMQPDILVVALGAPRQEKWIHENKCKLNAKVCIGVGGALDIFAGRTRLAPDFFRNNGLEWLYRLYKEPYRYKRMLRLPKYVLLALRFRFKKH